MTAALKKGDKTTLSVLRYVLSELNYSAIDKRGELTDEEIIKLLYKEIKKRQEAILLYRQGKREELAEKESKEMQFHHQFLKPILIYLLKRLRGCLKHVCNQSQYLFRRR